MIRYVKIDFIKCVCEKYTIILIIFEMTNRNLIMEHNAISFILYQPGVPGNIGASARAMKTMGFSDLRLVNPVNHLTDEARMMAHASWDILENCTVYERYADAVADLDFTICTTAKSKNAKVDYIPSTELGDLIEEKVPMVKKIGIIFGSEESGLPGSIIRQANAGVTILMQTAYPSLNLSQAVMVIAYELSSILSPASRDAQSPDPDHTEASWKALEERSTKLLEKAGILPSTSLHHRILERMSFLKESDARLVHSVTSRIMARLERR